MKRTEIARIFADMEDFGGQEVTVCGWTRTIRDMKNFGFIELNDGSCFKSIQVVFEDGTLKMLVPKKEAKPAVEEKKYIAIEG